jgi:hypothetical protein
MKKIYPGQERGTYVHASFGRAKHEEKKHGINL